MIFLLRFVLVSLGVIYLVTEASIAAGPRALIAKRSLFLGSLLYCPACAGFWIGLGLSFYETGLWPFLPITGWLYHLESAFVTMALGAIWSALHPNPAWEAESELRGEPPHDDR